MTEDELQVVTLFLRNVPAEAFCIRYGYTDDGPLGWDSKKKDRDTFPGRDWQYLDRTTSRAFLGGKNDDLGFSLTNQSPLETRPVGLGAGKKKEKCALW